MPEKKWWNNPWTCGVGGCCLGCVAIPLLMVGVFGIGIVGLVSQTGVYEDAAKLVRDHPVVIEQLGEPVETGWPRNVAINFDNGKGRASLSFPVSGPKGSGTLRVEARKETDTWEYQRLDLEVDGGGEDFDLLEAPITEEEEPGVPQVESPEPESLQPLENP